jgi:hypothetical protein
MFASPQEWSWRKWYEEYRRRGDFPYEFGHALSLLVRSVLRRFPAMESEDVQGREPRNRCSLGDLGAEVTFRVVHAVAHSKAFDGHYHAGWNDRQICGYLERIAQNALFKVIQELSPAWSWMSDRIAEVASKQLLLVDELRERYIPLEWMRCRKQWDEIDDRTLEARLARVETLRDKVLGRVPERMITETVFRLFESARSPIQKNTLVKHTLRVLGIADLRYMPPEQPPLGAEGTTVVDARHTKLDPLIIEIEMGLFLQRNLLRLNVEHLLVLKFKVFENEGDEEDPSFERVANRVRRVLGIKRFSGETARLRYLEAAELLGVVESQKYGRMALTEEEEETFADLLRTMIDERLRALGIVVENATERGEER